MQRTHTVSVNMRRSSPGKDRAFTLIEFLVVIASIAFLAAVVFPVFARAREKTRQTSCLSNLKPIGYSLMQSSRDYAEINILNDNWLCDHPDAGAPDFEDMAWQPVGLWQFRVY